MIREGISEEGALTQSSGNEEKDRGKQTARGKAAHVRGRENTKSLRWMGTWGAGGTEDGTVGGAPRKANGGRRRAGISRGFRSWEAWMAMTFQLQIREF